MLGYDRDPVIRRAQEQAIKGVLFDAAEYARGRRKFLRQASCADQIHGQRTAALRLVRGAEADGSYVRQRRGHAQVPRVASALAEPTTDEVVNMLDALPADEASTSPS